MPLLAEDRKDDVYDLMTSMVKYQLDHVNEYLGISESRRLNTDDRTLDIVVSVSVTIKPKLDSED